MITLAGIMADHPRAVERDIIHEGYRMSDIGNALSYSEFASIVLAAPRDSAVREAIDGGWSQTDHLLANLQEQRAGLVDLDARYARPGVYAPAEVAPEDLTPQDIPRDALGNVHLQTFDSIEEYEAARQAVYRANAERAGL